MSNEKIKEKLKNLPLTPGVYLMKDKDGDIIYVGKSKALKNRVSQYFQNTAAHTPKTRAMVEKVENFDYILTDTEAEALALECNLIKKYRPKYNILLKDDKQYPYIKITMAEDFPRIMMTRRVVRDGSVYFGPFMSGFAIKDTLEVIKKIFKIRSCKKVLPRDIGKSRTCLLYHLKQCSAPCSGKIQKEEYRAVFDKIEGVIKGDNREIIKELEEKMYLASSKTEYEKAAVYRDKIESIKAIAEKQKITSSKNDSRDVIGIFFDGKESCVRVFYIRSGKVTGTESFVFQTDNATVSETAEAFIKQFYFAATSIPKEIVIPKSFEEIEDVERWLGEKCGHRVRLVVPLRGEKLRFLEMVGKNAEEALKLHKFKRDKETADSNKILSELKATLGLSAIPYRIESYDISNISGKDSIGAEIVYNNAKPSRKDYRKFNIKTVSGADDYASMQEVIRRRILKSYEEEEKIASGELQKDKAKFLPLPDLILLDGGKGHISAVREVLSFFEEDIPVFGLVKDEKHRTRALVGASCEFPIDRDGELFKFITAMQEEVHRFAITAFRKKHEKSIKASELEEIKGIGNEKRKKLLKYFGSVEKIKGATLDELCLAIDRKSAENVLDYFNKIRTADK